MFLMNNELVKLSNDINIITAEINAYQQVAGEAIFQIGKRLKHVKENDLTHGDFGNWLKKVELTSRTAQRFMQAYEQFGNTTTSSLLSSSKIFEILSLPNEIDRQVFVEKPHKIPSTGETKTVDEMTARELREVKKALRQANEDKQILGQLLTEERNKQSEVEYVIDPQLKEQLRLYRERYGGISEDVYRITDETEISGMVMEFSEHTRDFTKQYACLKHNEGEFPGLNRRSKAEYESTLNALRDFLNGVQRVVEYSKTSTFQSCI